MPSRDDIAKQIVDSGASDLNSLEMRMPRVIDMQLAWQTTEKVPAELQRAALALYKEVESKHESGNLKSHDEGTSDDEELFEP